MTIYTLVITFKFQKDKEAAGSTMASRAAMAAVAGDMRVTETSRVADSGTTDTAFATMAALASGYAAGRRYFFGSKRNRFFRARIVRVR